MFSSSYAHYQDSVSTSQQQAVTFLRQTVSMSKLAQRLKEEREKKGWSQQELAEKAGIRQSFIGALESKNQQSSGWLPEIAHALGVDAYWLKTGKGQRSSISSDQGLDGLSPDIREQCVWLINNADAEIRTMFGLMVLAMHQKKQGASGESEVEHKKAG